MATNEMMRLLQSGIYRDAQGQIDPYRSRWTPGSWNGMVGPNGEAGSGIGIDQGTDAPSKSGLPASNQVSPEFWAQQGFTGNAFDTLPGESYAGLEWITPELEAWAKDNGYESGYTEGYGGVLKNGQIVPGTAFGNRTNDDAAFIAGALGIGAAGAAAAGAFGGAEVGAEALGEAGGYGFTSAEAGGLTELGGAGLGDSSFVGDIGGQPGFDAVNINADPSAGQLQTMGQVSAPAELSAVPQVSQATVNGGGGWLDTLGQFLGSSAGGSGGPNWGQVLGNLGSAALQSRSIDKANATQQAGTDAAIAEQRRQFDLTRTDQAPYRSAGVNALQALVDGTKAVPSHETVMSDPGYQFAQQQGERGLRNQFAASGGRMSGAQLKAGVRFNQGNASTGYNAAYQRLQDILNRKASIAGLGQTSTQASSAAGQNSANAISGLLDRNSDSQAAGQLARGNIWGNVGNNLLAQYGRKTRPRTVNVDGYEELTGD